MTPSNCRLFTAALAEQLDIWPALITTEWLPKFKIAKANVSFLAISALAAPDAIQKGQQTFRAFAHRLDSFSGDSSYRNYVQIYRFSLHYSYYNV